MSGGCDWAGGGSARSSSESVNLLCIPGDGLARRDLGVGC